MANRKENDSIGELILPADALYGIHAARAFVNFPDTTPFSTEWYKAMGIVKKAAYQTYRKFKTAAEKKYNTAANRLNFIDNKIVDTMIDVAGEIAEGKYASHFIVAAVQGGAGTSINMNINEIIANASLLKLNSKPGDYKFIDPVEMANIYQSTNDVVPTALRIAVLQLLNNLEVEINRLRKEIEKLEQKYRNVLRTGYTQMQEAVPTSYGKMFGAYNESLSRDWWRVSKCAERIKMVNIGGSAIGTSIAVPRYFVMQVVTELQQLTNLPIGRSENMPDATSNLDSWVEVHAILKANAVNLEKMVSDIRLLSADISRHNELKIPEKQAGSSIMPGKVNPVIPEFVISAAHKIYANDMLVSSLCGQGCLELNAYLPLIGHSIIESINLLIQSCNTMANNLFNGLQIDTLKTIQQVNKSTSLTTALVPHIGYNNATKLAKLMKNKEITIYEANRQLKIIDEKKLSNLLNNNNLLKTGFSLNELDI